MRLYLTRPRSSIKAVADYDMASKSFVVLKDSVSVVDGTRVIKDVPFKSASTAANFVTGASTNGLTAWKDENGKTLKVILTEMEGNNE